MIHWQDSVFRQGLGQTLAPADQWINNYLDAWAWWYLHTWFLPFKMPGLYSDVDNIVSQFTLNGIRSSNLCQAK